MVKEIYYWKEERDYPIKELYDFINEDVNWFHSKEDAIKWLNAQKKKNEDFGQDHLFILKELYSVS
jgi:hypothetical protein